jgi:hypothetical protein
VGEGLLVAGVTTHALMSRGKRHALSEGTFLGDGCGRSTTELLALPVLRCSRGDCSAYPKQRRSWASRPQLPPA